MPIEIANETAYSINDRPIKCLKTKDPRDNSQKEKNLLLNRHLAKAEIAGFSENLAVLKSGTQNGTSSSSWREKLPLGWLLLL